MLCWSLKGADLQNIKMTQQKTGDSLVCCTHTLHFCSVVTRGKFAPRELISGFLLRKTLSKTKQKLMMNMWLKVSRHSFLSGDKKL